MILGKFTFREVKNRPGRAMLTLLSIVIGIAAVVAVTVGTATTKEAFREMFNSVAGKAAVEVVAVGDAFFSDNAVAAIQAVPGVKAAVPSIQKSTILRCKDHRVGGMLVMGVDLTVDKAVRDYDLRDGRFFNNDRSAAKKREVLLEAGFARGIGVGVGDQVKLMTAKSGVESCTIVGLLAPSGAAGFKQGNIIFTSLPMAQSLFTRSGNVNLVSVVLDDSANEKTVSAAIAQALPKNMQVRTPAERSQLSKEMIEKVQRGLDFAYVAILALAFFTILNTFLMNVGERRRQLAVLRAIGATRRQLMHMLLVEGFAMGTIGTILGTLAGLGGAYLITQSMGKMYAAPMPSLRITAAPFIAAGLIGPLVSIFAMFVPAWIAGRISPLEGMRFVAVDRHTRLSAPYVITAFLAFVSTASIVGACIVGYLPVQIMTVAGTFFTITFLLILPMILSPLAWLLSGIFYPLLGTEGRVAHRQVLRRRVRTTLTVGILYIAVSTAVSLGTNILDTVDDIHIWTNKTLKGDFLIRAMNQDVGSGLSARVPESFGKKLQSIPGVANVDSLRFISTKVKIVQSKIKSDDGKQGVMVCVRDYTGHGELPLDIKAGDGPDLRKRLSEGQVVLGTVLAHRIGVKVGDSITLDTDNGPKELKVAATATAYMVGGMVVYMEGKTAQELLKVEGVDIFIVNAAPGMIGSVASQIQKTCEAEGLLYQSFADLQKRIDEMTHGVIGGLWGLLVLGLVVGAFAVANTLTMNVLEQTRELALLRVVAMTRWQVRKTIFSQAMFVGSIGLLTGTVGGMIGAYVMNLCTVPLLGHAPDFALHPSLLIACVLVGSLVILLAAWMPAERAARLKLLIALQYE